jgi:probable addiction module antidote protein
MAVAEKSQLPSISMDKAMSDKKTDQRLFRDNPFAISAYLSEAFEKNDLDTILKAINRVMRAQNVQAMAREAGLRRDRLYKTFGGEIDPHFGGVIALLNALGVGLTVKPLPPREIPKRPRLGRPPSKGRL